MEQDNRRSFLKTTGAALAAGFPALIRAQATNAIKVGLVGCGGRGTGAASQAMKADDYAELTAVADIYQERVDTCLEQLNKINGPKVKVDQKTCFPASMQARRCMGRNPGGVARITTSTPLSMSF